MPSSVIAPASPALPHSRTASTPRGCRSAWRRVASTAAIPALTLLGVISAGSPGFASPARPHFVPAATSVTWDKSVVTVTFQEVEVSGEITVISFAVAADVEIACTRGESTIVGHRSAKATDTYEYPVDKDGTVAGTAEVPLEVKIPKISGYTCVVRDETVTAVLEDFLTGASLEHKADPPPSD